MTDLERKNLRRAMYSRERGRTEEDEEGEGSKVTVSMETKRHKAAGRPLANGSRKTQSFVWTVGVRVRVRVCVRVRVRVCGRVRVCLCYWQAMFPFMADDFPWHSLKSVAVLTATCSPSEWCL